MENVKVYLRSNGFFDHLNIVSILIAFGILFGQAYMSTIYRISYGDASFTLFKMCTENDFFIPHHRYIAVLTEFLPLLGIKIGLSFKHLSQLFSINFTFSSFLLWVIYIKLTKNYLNSWILVLAQLFGYAQGYNHYVVEHIGHILILFYILLLDFYLKSKASNKLNLTAFCLIISSPFLHLNSLIILFIGVFYLFVGHTKKWKFILSLLISICILILFFKRIVFSFNSYEQSQLTKFIANFSNYKQLDNTGFSYYFRDVFLVHFELKLYFTLITIFIAYHQKWKFLFLGIVIYFSCFYFNCLLFKEWETAGYMEFYGLIIFCGILLALYFSIDQYTSKWGLYILFILGFHFSLNLIYTYQRPYRMREEYIHSLNSVARNHNISKSVILKSKIDYSILLHDWALPYESMNSSLIRDEKIVSLLPLDSFGSMDTIFPDKIISSVSTDSYLHIDTSYYKPLIAPYILF